MKVRATPPTTSCPSCATVNSFDAAQCSSCGSSLVTLTADAPTIELPPLERDPLVVELWHQLREATIGEFDIYSPIGRGGMATVFLGLDLALDREVALKVIAPTAWNSPSFLERFKREARTAAAQIAQPHRGNRANSEPSQSRLSAFVQLVMTTIGGCSRLASAAGLTANRNRLPSAVTSH